MDLVGIASLNGRGQCGLRVVLCGDVLFSGLGVHHGIWLTALAGRENLNAMLTGRGPKFVASGRDLSSSGSGPASTPMIAMTTSNSTNVNA
jgi:hypothetical protein